MFTMEEENNNYPGILDVRITRMTLRHPYITSHTRLKMQLSDRKGTSDMYNTPCKNIVSGDPNTYQQEMVSSIEGAFKNNNYNIT